ncbi:MAG TPA: hypothetical protein VM370_00590, partial [Candidatus Thermoplasmatota archaeon]|nr:hypothetical protein [Candidatus Thermoplasmatota archaeon]
MKAAALACILALLLSGCAKETGDGPATGASERVSYFHSAMTLVDAAEANRSVVRTGGFYDKWAAGTDYPTWVADPLGRDVLVTGANVTLYIQVTGPVVENPRFPDIMVYGGSGDAWMGFGSRTDYHAFTPG